MMRAAPLRRLPVYLLPALALLAVAAALLWLSPVGPALAQDDARPEITAGPVITGSRPAGTPTARARPSPLPLPSVKPLR